MSRLTLSAVVSLLAIGLAAPDGMAQQPAAGGKDRKTVNAESQGGIGDAFKGFGSNSKDPIQIEADNLEVRDQENMAVFSGNVTVRQKDTVMKTATLKVFYEPKSAGGEKTAENQQVRRYEAEGKVLITQNNQAVTGDTGWFDMRSQKAQISAASGNKVVVTQDKNIATGARLDVNLTTGQYALSGNRPTLVIESTGQQKN
jgi:lipopolysaccharide export system protein LptA